MKVYSYSQNKSGGFYCGPAQNIIVVDAKSEEHALETAEKAGLYLNGVMAGSDCECCGDRWHDTPREFDTVEEAKASAEKYSSPEGQGNLILDIIPSYLVTDDLDWD